MAQAPADSVSESMLVVAPNVCPRVLVARQSEFKREGPTARSVLARWRTRLSACGRRSRRRVSARPTPRVTSRLPSASSRASSSRGKTVRSLGFNKMANEHLLGFHTSWDVIKGHPEYVVLHTLA